MNARLFSFAMGSILFTGSFVPIIAQEPLHQRIDKAVLAGFKGPHAKPASDEEFLRRVYLDFTGVIPTAQQARDFLKDPQPSKRAQLIDRLD